MFRGTVLISLVVFGCSAAPVAPRVLSEVREEAPGATCINGGALIVSGTDTSGDGALSEDEVAARAYACNGSAGSDGAVGPSGPSGVQEGATPVILTRTSPEPIGSVDCPYGGTRIEAGFDDNLNGIFDFGELDSVSFVCKDQVNADVHYGSLYLRTQADITAAANITTVVGDVIIALDSAIAVELPLLTLVHGEINDCKGGTNRGWSLVLPKLGAAIGGISLACSTDLTTVQAPLLGYAGAIRIDGAPVTSLAFPLLTTVVTDFTVAGTPLPADFADLRAPKLDFVGGKLFVRNNANFQDCAVIAFAHARRVLGARIELVVANPTPCNDVLLSCPPLPVGDNPDGHRLCYYAQTWAQGEALCETIGAEWKLMYVIDEADRAKLSATRGLAFSGPGYWIGYRDDDVEGIFGWEQAPAGATAPTGPPFWAAGEPNDSGGNEDCAELRVTDRSLQAHDINCSSTDRYPVCRYLAP